MKHYYLRFKLWGNTTVTEWGKYNNCAKETALIVYRNMLDQGYQFEMCQLWSDNGFEYQIV